MTTTQVRLPAATVEDIEVRLGSYDPSPALVSWACALSADDPTLESGAPAGGDFEAATAVNGGTATLGPWSVKVRVSGLTAGTYGLWVKAPGATVAPVRYAGQVVLY